MERIIPAEFFKVEQIAYGSTTLFPFISTTFSPSVEQQDVLRVGYSVYKLLSSDITHFSPSYSPGLEICSLRLWNSRMSLGFATLSTNCCPLTLHISVPMDYPPGLEVFSLRL